jgi:TonB family protein
MRLQSYIISRKVVSGQWLVVSGGLFSVNYLLLTACCLLLTIHVFPQRIAVIAPEKNPQAEKITSQFTERLNAMDADLVEMAVKSQQLENIYNLSTEEAKILGKAVGCDFFIILKTENLRRTSFVKPLYFESYLAVYLVSARTGRLVFWTLKSFEGETVIASDGQLFASLNQIMGEVSDHIKSAQTSETREIIPTSVEELPEENSPEAKNFRSPLPFKRQVPVYKRLANLYGITATVDAVVDLDENGKVTRVEITRWAGYDLDESVKEVINQMEWRPASRDGKTLPIRVLLRYNFKKIEKVEQ